MQNSPCTVTALNHSNAVQNLFYENQLGVGLVLTAMIGHMEPNHCQMSQDLLV